jgi:molecular chaperone GrpE
MSEDDAADVEVEPPEDEAADADDGADEAERSALAARVAAHDEELAEEVERRAERVDELEADLAEREAELEDVTDRLKRTRADFQNYKKRAERRREELRERATEDLVERLVDVRDNLVRALEQDEDADIRDGVEATLAAFDRVLDDEGVEAIEPHPGDEVDPTRHEVMMRVDSDQPEGTVASRYQAGYEMAGSVIREAQVTVSDGAEADEE